MLLAFRLRTCVPASRVSPSRGEARRGERAGGRGFAEQQRRGEEHASCVIAVSGGSEGMQTRCATDADAGAAAAADGPDHSRTCLVQCTRPVRHYPAASLRLLCEQRDPDRLRITLRHGTSCLKGQIARVKHPLALNCFVWCCLFSEVSAGRHASGEAHDDKTVPSILPRHDTEAHGTSSRVGVALEARRSTLERPPLAALVRNGVDASQGTEARRRSGKLDSSSASPRCSPVPALYHRAQRRRDVRP